MFQNMDDLQTVAFESSAYNPIANRNDGKDKLKEVEIQKEGGYLEQDSVKAAPRPNILQNAETNDAVQDGLQQRNGGAACKGYDLCLIRVWFFLGNEITTCRDQEEDIF